MKEQRRFPLFNSHLDLAHKHWKEACGPSDWAIDATCGNGHDTLFLSKITAGVIALDIQKQAIQKTQELIEGRQNVTLLCQSHATAPDAAKGKPIKLIVYNLGYLPGADKSLTTSATTTMQSVQWALEVAKPGGLISITCYPGHCEGALEEKMLVDYASHFPPDIWSSSHLKCLNRSASPSLLLLQKKI